MLVISMYHPRARIHIFTLNGVDEGNIPLHLIKEATEVQAANPVLEVFIHISGALRKRHRRPDRKFIENIFEVGRYIFVNDLLMVEGTALTQRPPRPRVTAERGTNTIWGGVHRNANPVPDHRNHRLRSRTINGIAEVRCTGSRDRLSDNLCEVIVDPRRIRINRTRGIHLGGHQSGLLDQRTLKYIGRNDSINTSTFTGEDPKRIPPSTSVG